MFFFLHISFEECWSICQSFRLAILVQNVLYREINSIKIVMSINFLFLFLICFDKLFQESVSLKLQSSMEYGATCCYHVIHHRHDVTLTVYASYEELDLCAYTQNC